MKVALVFVLCILTSGGLLANDWKLSKNFTNYAFQSLTLDSTRRSTTLKETLQQLDSPKVVVRKNIRYYLANQPIKNQPKSFKVFLQLDSRKTFIRDFPVDLLGVNVGLVLRRRFRWGTGFYFLDKQFSNQLLPLVQATGRPIVDRQGKPIPFNKLEDKKIAYDTAQQNLTVYFGTLNFAFAFYASRLLELSIPVEVGYGKFHEKLIDPTGKDFASLSKTPQPTSGRFIPGQVGFATLIKIHRWVYFFSSIGYRKTLKQTFTSESKYTSFNSQFDGYYYRFALQLQVGAIWKDLHKNKNTNNIHKSNTLQ